MVKLENQNWSSDGVIRNSNASPILFDAEAAKYYESIFPHDWDQHGVPKCYAATLDHPLRDMDFLNCLPLFIAPRRLSTSDY